MKAFFILLSAALLFACQPGNEQAATQANVQEAANAGELALTELTLVEESYDFGEVYNGQVVSHTLKFKNTGDAPLYILDVKASCGCTTPAWSQDAIAPGEEGFVTYEFNSTGRMGVNNKLITIRANTAEKAHMHEFTATVVEAQEQ